MLCDGQIRGKSTSKGVYLCLPRGPIEYPSLAQGFSGCATPRTGRPGWQPAIFTSASPGRAISLWLVYLCLCLSVFVCVESLAELALHSAASTRPDPVGCHSNQYKIQGSRRIINRGLGFFGGSEVPDEACLVVGATTGTGATATAARRDPGSHSIRQQRREGPRPTQKPELQKKTKNKKTSDGAH